MLNPAAKLFTTEKDKVSCHLSIVIRELKATTDVAINANGEKSRFCRMELISEVEEYIKAGRFPKHEDQSCAHERKPCFVDSNGTPCAVAYLMQKSGADGLVLANTISLAHKHDTIDQICQDNILSPAIKAWTTMVGIQPSELALIQPTYEFVAAECRNLFKRIYSKLQAAIESKTCMKGSKEDTLKEEIVHFGTQLDSGFGYPLADISGYLEKLNSLKIPNEKAEIKALVVLLRNELESRKS